MTGITLSYEIQDWSFYFFIFYYTGVTTIAGGKWGQAGGHVDGPSEDAKFSNDFDIVYVGSSCSLLVIDRGNQAIREIQLNHDDCTTYEYDGSFHLGMPYPPLIYFPF